MSEVSELEKLPTQDLALQGKAQPIVMVLPLDPFTDAGKDTP